MPFALVIIGLIMVVSGVKGTHEALGAQLRSDFQPFVMWMAAIGAIGALGYVPELRRFSHYFMALIIVGMVLSNKGFFPRLMDAIKKGPIAPPAAAKANNSPDANTPFPLNNVTPETAAKMGSWAASIAKFLPIFGL